VHGLHHDRAMWPQAYAVASYSARKQCLLPDRLQIVVELACLIPTVNFRSGVEVDIYSPLFVDCGDEWLSPLRLSAALRYSDQLWLILAPRLQ